MYRERMLFGGRFPGNLESEVFMYKHTRVPPTPTPALLINLALPTRHFRNSPIFILSSKQQRGLANTSTIVSVIPALAPPLTYHIENAKPSIRDRSPCEIISIVSKMEIHGC